jgi:hypothetical protein
VVVFVPVVLACAAPLLWFQRTEYFGAGPRLAHKLAVDVAGALSGQIAPAATVFAGKAGSDLFQSESPREVLPR